MLTDVDVTNMYTVETHCEVAVVGYIDTEVTGTLVVGNASVDCKMSIPLVNTLVRTNHNSLEYAGVPTDYVALAAAENDVNRVGRGEPAYGVG